MIFNFFVFVFLASAISSHASSEMHEYVESLHALEPSKKARKLLYPTPYRNSNYLTLAPEFKPVGPSFNYTDDTINISELHKQSVDFYTKVFRSIVVDAHNLAKDFYQEGDNNNWTYYTFMVLALVTPHHESRMTHFRTVSGDKCSPDINDLHAYFNPISYKKVSSSIFQNKALSDTAKVLRSNFKNPYNTLVPNCDQIDKSKIVQQVLTSTNLMDFGLYQINIKSHYADFLQPERALNLYSLIKNGIHYLWNQKSDDGFYELRNSIEYDLAKITNENAPELTLYEMTNNALLPIKQIKYNAQLLAQHENLTLSAELKVTHNAKDNVYSITSKDLNFKQSGKTATLNAGDYFKLNIENKNYWVYGLDFNFTTGPIPPGCEFMSNPYSNVKHTESRWSYNAIRGAWAGYYNQGRGSAIDICRFNYPGINNYKHDEDFKVSLDALTLNHSSFYHRFLPKKSNEYLALKEIIENFKNIHIDKNHRVAEKNHFIKKILNSPHTQGKDNLVLNYQDYQTNAYLNGEKIKVYYFPQKQLSTGESTLCGTIDNPNNNTLFETRVVDRRIYNSNEQREWAVIQLPKYENFLSPENGLIVRLKNKEQTVNIRTSAESLSSNNLYSMNGSAIAFSDFLANENAPIKYLGQENNYYKIELHGQELFVHSNYFEVVANADIPDNSEFAQRCMTSRVYFIDSSYVEDMNKTPIGSGVLVSNYIRIFSEPNWNSIEKLNTYPTKNQLHDLQVFTVITRNDKKWFKIKFGSIYGWTNENFIEHIKYTDQVAITHTSFEDVN